MASVIRARLLLILLLLLRATSWCRAPVATAGATIRRDSPCFPGCFMSSYVAMKLRPHKGLQRIPREKVGSPGRTRTSDPAVNSRLLYQLSYRGAERAHVKRRYDVVDSKRQEGFPELCANPRNWRPARRRRGLRRRRIALMSGFDPPRAQAPRWPTKSACSIATGTCRNRSRSASGSAFCSSPAACSASCPCSASG